MAYMCVYHDGEAEAANIHQKLGTPGVISVCDDCQPIYLITALAEILGIDSGGLYDAVRSYQVAVQAQGEVPGPESLPDDVPVPDGPHPAAEKGAEGSIIWLWCSCDHHGPHDGEGNDLAPDVLAQLREERCEKCDTAIQGTADTILTLMADHAATHKAAPRSRKGAGK